MKALFLAGGSGTRLWPLSRKTRPKQLHVLFGEKSMMTQTVDRVRDLVDAKDIWIITAETYLEVVSQQCPSIPVSHLITEPFPLGTNLAVGLGLVNLLATDPEAIVLLGWADSYVGDEAAFTKAVDLAREVAARLGGVLLTAPPTYPATCYGYIETGEVLGENPGAFKIKNFEEKPTIAKAREFIKTGKHFWNSGFSVWRASYLLELMREHSPEHYQALQSYASCIGTPMTPSQIGSLFSKLEPLSIDKAVFEKASGLAAVPVSMDWNDIGSWSAVYDVQTGLQETVSLGEVVSIDTEKCLMMSNGRLIATLGLSDLVIVETQDVVLVVHKDQTERLKELHEAVRNQSGDKYL